MTITMLCKRPFETTEEVRTIFSLLLTCIPEQEGVIFADQVLKLNRRNKPERRDFVMTDQAFYVVMRAVRNGQSFYKVSRRTAIADIQGVTLSTLCDNYIVFHVPREYDHLMETPNKTECLILLVERYEMLTGRTLQLNFQDTYALQMYYIPTLTVLPTRSSLETPESLLSTEMRALNSHCSKRQARHSELKLLQDYLEILVSVFLHMFLIPLQTLLQLG